MNIHPRQNSVLAKQRTTQERTLRGSFIPHKAKENQVKALLISVGSDKATEINRVPALTLAVKTGDKGLMGNHSGAMVDIDVKGHVILDRVLRDISSLAWDLAPGVELHGRVKSIQSVLAKMRTNRLGIDQLMDYFGVRVIMSKTCECYRLVEQIHRKFKVIEGEYDDYIQSPKPNGYRSLHTTVIASSGYPIEVQVRTRWMNALAERGTAAHWIYKKR